MRRWALALALGMAGCGNTPLSGDDTGGDIESQLGALRESVPNEVLIQWRAGASEQDKQGARNRGAAQRLEHVADHGNGELELASLPPGLSVADAARAIGADAAVAYAEPNWIYQHTEVSSDPYFTGGSLWGMYGDESNPANAYGSQAADAWAAGATGPVNPEDTVYVGVIDEGIQTTHPDLASNVWVNPFDPVDGVDNDGNGKVDDQNGWDFANNDASVYDGGTNGKVDKHGTHVSGTIGAANNGQGVVGVIWNVKLISAKFLGRNGGTTANAVKAVDYLTDLKTRHGLRVVASNNSWGGGGFSQSLYDAIARAQAADVLFIAAAGNGDRFGRGINSDATPQYPASYALDNVIAVAAIDSAGGKASFSNYGATSVDLGAPGVNITSTLAPSTYGAYSGTSMATPHVTGAAALYAATHVGATAAQVKNALLTSTIATPSLAGKVLTNGRLDVATALTK